MAQPDPAADSPEASATPTTSTQALAWAATAYDIGDLNRMVDLSRLVAEGALPGDDDQRAQALRMLGIGLYLSGRADGAERAFVDLLKLHPSDELDARMTRPEVVAFFREVKRRNRPKRYWALSFLPPLGQFQNETPRRGWVIGGIEAATLVTTLSTRLVLASWVRDDDTCRNDPYNPAPCRNLRIIHLASAGALAATWIYGVVDALVNLDHGDANLGEPRLSFVVAPNAAGFRLRF